MSNRMSAKWAPLAVFVLAGSGLVGCGGDELAQLSREVATTKAAQLNQTDLNSFTSAIKLSSCTFVVGGGSGTFTPSNELAQAIYGDPNGKAHATTFTVPPITSGSTSVELTSLVADMTATGITLSGSTATVRLAFSGKLHVKVPILGSPLTADIQIKPSTLDSALSYDKPSDRVKATAVTSHFDVKTSNCGLFGWCNGLVDSYLKANLATAIEGPLRDALTKGLDSASATTGFTDLLAAGYNLKDPQPTKWTLVAGSLSQAAGAFSFTAQRP